MPRTDSGGGTPWPETVRSVLKAVLVGVLVLLAGTIPRNILFVVNLRHGAFGWGQIIFGTCNG